ncbi:uncharacterized protein F4807DRAFT_435204 [Annulohypoxylon truncatum]|uniref:uncharacterized protein n=1 Tax=Annulohypoxylon truncatum TaxID=327061 RepID=UPI002007406C|nr:uncharacterized protein F4807DRAFT_435204 [Annulohypoxylon truncatum]KAI1207294.1 hypothetical protein F4807DRAFT_435204 [Annulohypoxylon truncatum]
MDTTTAVGAVLAFLSIVFVGMRFYARRLKNAGLKWDDWLIVASLVAMLATDILAICASTTYPNGAEAATEANDTSEYTPEDAQYTKLSYITLVIYFSLTSTTKLSVLFMYHRLFSVSESFRRQTILLGVLVIGFWIGCTVANLLDCVPMKYTWINSLADPRYCFNYNIYWFASGICEAFIDLWIILLPIRVVLSLQLNRKQKVAVVFVFMLGFFVLASGLLKAGFAYIPGSRQPSFVKTQLWTTVHCATGIICACLPVCWPLLTRASGIRPSKWPGNSSLRRLWNSIGSSSRLGRSRAQINTDVPDLGWPQNTFGRKHKFSNSSSPRGDFIPLKASNEDIQPVHYEYRPKVPFNSVPVDTISPV